MAQYGQRQRTHRAASARGDADRYRSPVKDDYWFYEIKDRADRGGRVCAKAIVGRFGIRSRPGAQEPPVYIRRGREPDRRGWTQNTCPAGFGAIFPANRIEAIVNLTSSQLKSLDRKRAYAVFSLNFFGLELLRTAVPFSLHLFDGYVLHQLSSSSAGFAAPLTAIMSAQREHRAQGESRNQKP